MKKTLNVCLIIFFLLYAIGQFSSDIKMLSRVFYLLFIFLSVFLVSFRKKILVPIKVNDIIFFIYLSWSTLYGIHNGFYPYTLDEMFAFASLWLSWKIVVFSYENKLLYVALIQKYLYYVMILWFSVYVFTGIGAVLGFIPDSVIIAALSEWVKNRGQSIEMVSDILQGTTGFLGMLPRLSTGLNIVPLIILLLHSYKNKGINPFVWFLGLLFIFIDYGRVDVFVFVIATIIAIMPRIKKVSNVYWGRILLPAVIVVVIFSVLLFESDVSYLFQSIFVNDRTYASNLERIQQYDSLIDGIIENPFWGSGMGAYIVNNIRNEVNCWEYELQVLAFVFQLGIVGFILIVINFIGDYILTVWKYTKGCRIGVFLIYVIWIVASCIQGGIFFDGKIILPILFFMSIKSEEVN